MDYKFCQYRLLCGMRHFRPQLALAPPDIEQRLELVADGLPLVGNGVEEFRQSMGFLRDVEDEGRHRQDDDKDVHEFFLWRSLVDVDQARTHLDSFDSRADLLRMLADYVIERRN